MDTSKYYQTDSKFLKADNLLSKDGKRYAEMSVMISDVAPEEMHDDAGEVRIQLSIGFEGKTKRMLLNKTNYQAVSGAYGVDSDGWVGKELILYVDPYVRFKDKTVPGLRIRPTTPTVGSDEIPF